MIIINIRKTPKVLILDSGVNLHHPKIVQSNLKGYNIKIQNEEIKISKDFTDNFGHGTAIYNIIQSQCKDIQISIENVKFYNRDIKINDNNLAMILEYIYENSDCNIINISCGLNIGNNLDRLYKICKKFYDSNRIIISAFDNFGSMSYPAAFDCTIGVTSSENIKNVSDFEYFDDNIVNIAAKGSIQRLAWVNPDYILLGGNSFACAHVTAQVAKFLEKEEKCFKDVLQDFKKISLSNYFFRKPKKEKKLFDIHKAVLFPFNKEIHSLLKYFYMLDFEIIDVYNEKYSGTVGANTCHLLKDNTAKSLTIKNINNIDFNTFDTFILGHTETLYNSLGNSESKNKLIKRLIDHQKNIYSFDDLKMDIKDKYNIYFPKVDIEDLPPNRFGKLYRISKPVLGVFGTSSRQGKFTLQLLLRKKLLELGYNLGQIGTEPSSLLYNMDYVFPMGYNSSVYIKEFDVIMYINNIINSLCIKNKDLIIAGSQSGTLPYDTGNISQFNIPQYNFLMGLQPDVVILCINPFDRIEYIKRTINFIEASVNCKILGLVMFPMDLEDNWLGIYSKRKKLDIDKYITIKQQLFNNLNYTIYNLDLMNDIDNLVKDIINYF